MLQGFSDPVFQQKRKDRVEGEAREQGAKQQQPTKINEVCEAVALSCKGAGCVPPAGSSSCARSRCCHVQCVEAHGPEEVQRRTAEALPDSAAAHLQLKGEGFGRLVAESCGLLVTVRGLPRRVVLPKYGFEGNPKAVSLPGWMCETSLDC